MVSHDGGNGTPAIRTEIREEIMKVGDLVKKRGRRGALERIDLIIGVVVEVEGSHCRVNFGDYGTFWQSLQQIEFLS